MALKIRRVRIVNYRGVQELDTDNVSALPNGLAPAGLIVRGENGVGKSSILRAIQAALSARDIGADAIRIGETRAEILVDMSEIVARRVITADGSKLTVTGADGGVKAKPQTLLAELLGTAALDPIELFLEHDEKKRRAIILAALPIRVTAEDLDAWLPDWAVTDLDGAPGAYDLGAHGLEACAQVRKFFYDRRTDVNRALKTATQKVEAHEAAVRERVARAPKERVSTIQAVAALHAAQDKAVRLSARSDAAAEAEARTAGLRERIAKIRGDADATLAQAASLRVPQEYVDQAKYEVAQKGDIVESLRAAIAKAEEDREHTFDVWDSMRKRNETAEGYAASEVTLRSQADEMERTVAAMTTEAPSPADMLAADQEIEKARAVLAASEESDKLEAARVTLTEARAEEKRASDMAGKLTGVIDTLTHDAPSALLKRGDAIPGLGLLEDGGITLDGVALHALSGRQKLKFAVEVARRANAKAKFLIVDELERLDSKHLDEFVKDATRDGFQLIATRVADGDVVLESIQSEEST